MQFLYGLADTKYHREEIEKRDFLPQHKFRRNSLLAKRDAFNRHQWPTSFRVDPAPLVELCVSAVDQLPIPSVFKWTDMDVCRWILRYGYPQYMNTFRVNMIWGRKLLLLDANALCAMNIKDFDHIKRIAYGIRMLFHFELTKFSSSVSLPDEKLHELYLLWHTQTGINYDQGRCSDLLRRFQAIRQRSPNLGHWDLLEVWLRRERERNLKEFIGCVPRLSLYACREKTESGQLLPASESFIWYDSPFDCISSETTKPALKQHSLSTLMHTGLQRISDAQCSACIPPCECSWPSRYYLTGTVFRCLKTNFPQKFAPTFQKNAFCDVREISNRWTRFSI